MTWLVFALLIVAAVALAAWWVQRQSEAAIRRASEALTQQAQEAFTKARQADAHALDVDKTAVQAAIKGLEEQLKRYEKLVSDFEKDRDQQYGKLATAIDNVVGEAKQLGLTTGTLAAVLEAARRLGACTAAVAAYGTSADAGGDPASAIGYAGMIIR